MTPALHLTKDEVAAYLADNRDKTVYEAEQFVKELMDAELTKPEPEYRILERRGVFYPQRNCLGIWFPLLGHQDQFPTLEAAKNYIEKSNEIIHPYP